MSKSAYYTATRMLKNTKGMVGDLPRIYNIDRDVYCLGYASFNQDATSPFARTKVHKGRFEGEANIQNGDLVLDRYDNTKYLVMNIKGVYSGGSNGVTAYKDAALYYVNRTCTVSRAGSETRNKFGRPDASYTEVYTNIPIMSNPQNYSIEEIEETILQTNKIRLSVQSKYALKCRDKIFTSTGQSYIVENIDYDTLDGLLILYVNTSS